MSEKIAIIPEQRAVELEVFPEVVEIVQWDYGDPSVPYGREHRIAIRRENIRALIAAIQTYAPKSEKR
jgi:hypothetical protein